MNEKEFHCFMKAQADEILKYKWIESEKVGHDIGNNKACNEWIIKFARIFRIEWEGRYMLNEKLSEYQATIINVNHIEKKIEDFFQLLATRDNPRFDRCADYGERSIYLNIPFDELNMQQLTIENINKIKKLITDHRELRKTQKNLENEVAQFEAVNNNMKDSMYDHKF